MIQTILNWNIDGIGQHMESVRRIVDDYNVDIVCLQEPKPEKGFTTKDYMLRDMEHFTIYESLSENASNYGTATYSRNGAINFLTHEEEEAVAFMIKQGRFHSLEYEAFYVSNLYMPYIKKANAKDKLTLEDKWAAYNWILDKFLKLEKEKPLIICTDFNCGTYYREISDRLNKRSDPGLRNEERAMIAHFKTLFTDALTYFYKDEAGLCKYIEGTGKIDLLGKYTFDYIFVSNQIKDRIQSVELLTDYWNMYKGHIPLLMKIDI